MQAQLWHDADLVRLRTTLRESEFATKRRSFPVRASHCFAVCVLLLLAFAGCSVPRIGGSLGPVNDELLARTSHDVACVAPGEFVLPPDANFEDGLSEDEAIATALSNNSAFQATLAQLGMAEGDLIQAGLLTNPNFTTFLPVSVKQWEWALFVPIETFVLRPQRLKVAGSQYENVAHQLVQNGLTLVRDVRVAYADLAVAIAQWKLSLEAVKIRQTVADLTEKRLNRGDISELEVMTARIDALNANANAAALEQQVVIARSRLALLMGLPPDDDQLEAELTKPPPVPTLDVAALVDEAFAIRPEAQAAQWAVTAAAHRARLSRWLFWRVDTVADANAKGHKGYEVGPGLRFDIPIFNRNQGGVKRSDAELTQALFNRDAVYQQIVQEVRTAAAQWTQADKQLSILEGQVAPELKEAMKIAEKGFDDGGTDYLLVLLTTTQYLDVRARVLDQLAALRRARAELERSVGSNLDSAPEELPLPPLPEGVDAPGAAEEIER
jgi:cobalt-zinc-cadmium efflux system outer membrane protein